MDNITDQLELATPSAAEPPSVGQLRSVIHRRRLAKRLTGGTVLVAVLAVVVTTAGSFGSTGRVETVGHDGPTSTENTNAIETAPDQTTGTTAAETSTTLSASESRWFLVPPDNSTVRVRGDHLIWSEAQSQFGGLNLVLSSDPEDISNADLALVYYLPDATRDRIGPPGSASRESHLVTIDSQTIRVTTDPKTGAISTYRSEGGGDTGVVVVIGAGISEDEALDISLATVVTADEPLVQLGTDFRLQLLGERTETPYDHRTFLRWNNGNRTVALAMSPLSLPEVAVQVQANQEFSWVTTRGADALYSPAVADQSSASLVWEYEGFVMTLTLGEDTDSVPASELVAEAEGLVRVSQPQLTRQLVADTKSSEYPYLPNQAETIGTWLDEVPLPPWVDPTPLTQGVPSTHEEEASFVYAYLECTWVAELIDAASIGDIPRARSAVSALASRDKWPVTNRSPYATTEEISEHERFLEDQNLELQNALGTASGGSVEAVAAQFEEGGGLAYMNCGFVVPQRP